MDAATNKINGNRNKIMPLDHEEIMRNTDRAYEANQDTREVAANDMVFYHVTQWDEGLLYGTNLSYRGEYNIVKKAGRQILSDLAASPVQINFQPEDMEREDGAELLDGLYRTDDQDNCSIEAYENSKQETVVCGYGAWRIYTEYESLMGLDNRQVVKREPLYEANNNLFWDPQDKSIDKRNSEYGVYVQPFTVNAYKQLVNDLTGESIEKINPSNFKSPYQSLTFPWIYGNNKFIYVGEYYHREKYKRNAVFLRDPFGVETVVWEDKIEDVIDELKYEGFEFFNEKETETYKITQYIVSGEDILDKNVIPGIHIPIVPMYGEHSVVEGMEIWEGVTRLAKDPQRARNFALSYIADIASRSPRVKPIYWPEQLGRFRSMYEENGIDDNFPYYLMERKDPEGNDLPLGPIGTTPEQPVPSSINILTDLTRQAVEDVANPGLPTEIADRDISGIAVSKLQQRLDQQSYIYQLHFKYAKRRDGDIYASIQSEIQDTPRRVVLTLPDGTRKEAMIMQSVVDNETGDIVTINDITNQSFKVYSTIGPDYKTQREETVSKINEILPSIDPGDPMRKALVLKALELMQGVEFDDIRKYARMQLVIAGVKEPETEEEINMVQQMQQQQGEPSPEMLLAQAEMLKGQADLKETERKTLEMQLKYSGELADNQIDTFDAQTKRMKVQVDAQKAGADINMKNVETVGKKIDNIQKVVDLNEIKRMSTEQLQGQLKGRNV